VGDLFLSLIQTCDLNGVNSFDYLVELLKHAPELAVSPAAWMPWNYRETLTRAGPPAN
jgi:transposase